MKQSAFSEQLRVWNGSEMTVGSDRSLDLLIRRVEWKSSWCHGFYFLILLIYTLLQTKRYLYIYKKASHPPRLFSPPTSGPLPGACRIFLALKSLNLFCVGIFLLNFCQITSNSPWNFFCFLSVFLRVLLVLLGTWVSQDPKDLLGHRDPVDAPLSGPQ